MARPKKDQIRDKRIKINFTLSEYETLNKKYNESKMYHSLNEMIRDILLGNQYKIITKDQELLIYSIHLVTAAKKIGNNFNQLLKHLNQKKLDTFSTEERNIMMFNLQEIKNFYLKLDDYLKR